MRRRRDAPLIAGDLPVFSPKWGMTADGKRPPFDQIAIVPPIASGPYLIEQRKNDKQIILPSQSELLGGQPAVAARHVPLRAHHVSALSRPYTPLEAFKAGMRTSTSNTARPSGRANTSARTSSNGLLKKGEFPDGPAQMQGLLINMRKPMFADVRVRHALTLGFRLRLDEPDDVLRSVPAHRTAISRPVRLARPAADQKELALLEPFRSKLAARRVRPHAQAADTVPPHSLRANLREARDLLAQPAGTIATARCATPTALR